MNLARRSSRDTWRITSGRRYFSAAAMGESFLSLLILRRLRLANRGQQLLNDVLAGFALGLSLEIGADAVAKDRNRHFLNVVDGDAEAPVHGRDGLAALDQKNAGPRPRAPI